MESKLQNIQFEEVDEERAAERAERDAARAEHENAGRRFAARVVGDEGARAIVIGGICRRHR